jgi:excisionase family DNA binding protein
MDSIQEDAYLTVDEIAARFKVNPQTVRNWISQGDLRAVRSGARRVRVLPTDLDRFLAATGATELPDPSQDRRAAVDRNEELAAALQRARAALAADRKTDLAIALHTLVAAAEPFLDSGASHQGQTDAEDQASEAPPAND